MILCFAVVGVWSGIRLGDNPSLFSPSEVSPFLTALGVLVALLTLLRNGDRAASEDYLESARDLIAKAYQTLNVIDDGGRPKNNRMHWLTSARMIRTAEHIGSKISVQSHKEIWVEELEYWRGRFYDLIHTDIEGFPETYYAEKPEHMDGYTSGVREPLSEKSLAVLYRFIKWPQDRPDSLQDECVFSDEEIETMSLFGPRGLGRLLEKVRRRRRSS